MALPYSPVVDNIPPPQGCTTLFDAADAIRTVAFDAYKAVACQDCGTDLRSYVTVGLSVDEFFGDAVIVSLADIQLATGSEGTRRTALQVIKAEATFRVTVLDAGWPIPEWDQMGNLISVPAHDVVNALARHSYAHAEAIWRSIVNRAAAKTLISGGAFSNVIVQPMQPLEPQGDLVGWQMSVICDFHPGAG